MTPRMVLVGLLGATGSVVGQYLSWSFIAYDFLWCAEIPNWEGPERLLFLLWWSFVAASAAGLSITLDMERSR